MSYGIDRRQFGCFPGWISPEDNADHNGDNDDHHKRRRFEGNAEIYFRKMFDERYCRHHKQHAQQHTEQTTQQRYRQRLGQKLHGDGFAFGAEGFSDADFAGAFGDRHQQDIHHADAAHEYRDAHDHAHHDFKNQDGLLQLFQPEVVGEYPELFFTACKPLVEPLLCARFELADIFHFAGHYGHIGCVFL